MRANTLRRTWAGGGKTVNGWLSIPAPFAAEVMAHQGWDSLTVDMQHGVVDYQAMVTMLQAVSTTATVPMVRVPWLEPGIVMKSLDAGAYGVICPMISTAEQAAAFASFCRYPPLGQRSFGPIRGLIYGGPDYPDHANDEILGLAMIETRDGLANLEAILDVPGIDGVYVGPSDLAAGLGKRPGFDPEDPELLAAFETIVKAAKARGRFAGIHTMSPGYAARMHRLGFDFATIGSDSRLMAMKAQEVLKAVKDTAPAAAPQGY